MNQIKNTHITKIVAGMDEKNNRKENRSGAANEVIDIQSIREKVEKGKYRISFTHTEKLRERKVEIMEIEESISVGEVIEAYPGDPRGPSCLILGFTYRDRPLHIVCGDLEGERILVITAYEPSLEEWKEDWKTRR